MAGTRSAVREVRERDWGACGCAGKGATEAWSAGGRGSGACQRRRAEGGGGCPGGGAAAAGCVRAARRRTAATAVAREAEGGGSRRKGRAGVGKTRSAGQG
ncbi:hypothetical protein BS78_K335900 [Paspalum vaginatum]|uniref:Uncharacterized protein n=1 Tax=Paspalum vaginatum TaxID=158149 RepID=A0A9W8CEQ3_9POAL|nr:hypothetical protein BS78_K335900 [Paspalum vaginatum]